MEVVALTLCRVGRHTPSPTDNMKRKPSPDDLRTLAAADNPAADVVRFVLVVEGHLPHSEGDGVPSIDAADGADAPAD